MEFFRKVIGFGLILIALALGGYFCAYNLDWIYVQIPYIGQWRVRAATAFFVAFLVGAGAAIIYFGVDATKKSLMLRRKTKRIRELEQRLSHVEHDRTLTRAPLSS